MESEGNEKQADEFVKKAEEILHKGKLKSIKGPSKKTGMLYDIPTNSDKIAKALALYIKAANQYKLCKAWEKAGNALVSAAQLQVLGKREGNYAAANNYIKSSDMFRKIKDNPSAIKSLDLAVKILLDDGKFVKAAQTQKILADLSIEEGKLVDAVMNLEKASDYFFGDSTMQATGHNCLNKAAYIAIDADEMQWAVDLFEKAIAHHCMQIDMIFNIRFVKKFIDNNNQINIYSEPG